jgi:hypothetical protein
VTTGRGEDEAWRAIVDNYGERAQLDDESSDEAVPAPSAAAEPPASPVPDAVEEEPEERFVPPVPPPAPRQPLPKRLAWLAVLGSPALLVVALLVSYDVPPLVGYALVGGFVGGFGYLVATMQRSGERNPWDDGAQL